MAVTQAIYYRDKRGAEPVNRFIEALPGKRAAKIDDYIEEHLNGQPPDAPPPEFPISSQIEGKLRELRVRFANTRYRVLYQQSGNLIVLLHAFEKNTGAVPASEKAVAKRRIADFKGRMDAKSRKPPRAAGKDAPSNRRSGS
jgi:phage-related protein